MGKYWVGFAVLFCSSGAFPQKDPSCVKFLSKPLEAYVRYTVVDQNRNRLNGKLIVIDQGLWFFPEFAEPILMVSLEEPGLLEPYVSLVKNSFVIDCGAESHNEP